MKNLKMLKQAKCLLAIELLGLIILLGIMIGRMRSNSVYTAELKDFVTENDSMKFDGEKWQIDSYAGDNYVGGEGLIYGPNIPLARGTYTIVIDYSSTEINKGVVESDSGIIDTADYFLLSNNKTEVRYDFAAKTAVKGFKFRLKEYYGGEFQLLGVQIIKNTHDIRVALFSWLALCIIINLLYFNKTIRCDRKTLFIILGIGVLASLPLFSKGIMTGNDIRFHLLRIEALVSGLKSRQIPVRMYSVFNDDYGYPVGIYYGDLLLYIPAILRIIGFPVLQSYKLFIVFTNVITAAISYWCGKRIFRTSVVTFVFSLAFTLSTYRLICVYARAAVGEFSATCFYPIILLAIYKIYTSDVNSNEYKHNFIYLAIGMSGLIYTHILSTEMAVIVLFFIAIVNYKKTFRKQTLIVYLKAIALCVMMTLSFTVPFIEYYRNVNTMLDDESFKSTYIQDAGAYISEYFSFFKSITGGDYINRRGLMTPGLLLMCGVAIGLFLWIKNKATKAIKFSLIGSVLCLIVGSNIFPWNRIYDIPELGQLLVSVQFPYRYTGMAACFMSLLLGLGLDVIIEEKILDISIVKYVIATAIIMTCFFTGQYEDEQRIVSILYSYDTADLYTYTRNGNFGISIGFEYLLDDTNASKEVLDYAVYGQNTKAVILGENGLDMELYVESTGDATLEVPRFAYPYFTAEDKNGKKLNIETGYNNRISVLIDGPYNGEIYIKYKEPGMWRIAELCSLISIGLLIVSACINTRGRKRLYGE